MDKSLRCLTIFTGRKRKITKAESQRSLMPMGKGLGEKQNKDKDQFNS